MASPHNRAPKGKEQDRARKVHVFAGSSENPIGLYCNGRSGKVTTDRKLVTCSRCLAKLKTDDAAAAIAALTGPTPERR